MWSAIEVGKLFIPPKVMTGLPDCSTVAAVNASQSIYGFVFCLHRDRAYAPNNWQESEATDSNVPVENVAGTYAEGYDVQIAKAIAEGLGKELVIVKLSWDAVSYTHLTLPTIA